MENPNMAHLINIQDEFSRFFDSSALSQSRIIKHYFIQLPKAWNSAKSCFDAMLWSHEHVVAIAQASQPHPSTEAKQKRPPNELQMLNGVTSTTALFKLRLYN